MTSYKAFWQNYVNFSGRSTRADYWIPTIINAIIIGVLSAIAGADVTNRNYRGAIRFGDYLARFGVDCATSSRYWGEASGYLGDLGHHL